MLTMCTFVIFLGLELLFVTQNLFIGTQKNAEKIEVGLSFWKLCDQQG